jgi:hypothetical protein
MIANGDHLTKILILIESIGKPTQGTERGKAPVVTPSKAARYISFRVGSSAKRAARPAAEIITVTGRGR